MNDLLPFKHGEEGTHAVCNKHNIGGKSVCCECSGKTDCSDEIVLTSLHTLLDDEQNAFEKRFVEFQSDYRPHFVEWKGNTHDTSAEEAMKWLALHDQKIITAVIGMIEKMTDENDDGMWAGRETADKIVSVLQQALKKEMV